MLQIQGESDPPRVFHGKVEIVLPFALRRRLNFDACQLAVHAIDDAEDEREDRGDHDVPGEEERGRHQSQRETGQGNLVGSDGNATKPRHKGSLDRGMNIGGYVERSVLGGIENDTLGFWLVRCIAHRKAKGANAAPHGGDISGIGCGIERSEPALVNLASEVL